MAYSSFIIDPFKKAISEKVTTLAKQTATPITNTTPTVTERYPGAILPVATTPTKVNNATLTPKVDTTTYAPRTPFQLPEPVSTITKKIEPSFEERYPSAIMPTVSKTISTPPPVVTPKETVIDPNITKLLAEQDNIKNMLSQITGQYQTLKSQYDNAQTSTQYEREQSKATQDALNSLISQLTGQYNDTNAKLLAEQEKSAAEKQRQTEFQNYINNFSLGVSKDDYIKNAKDVATSGANLQYDTAINSLKNRVANAIQKYQSKLKGLDNAYNPAYLQNEQAKFEEQDRIKNTLAETGNLNSGIELGNMGSTDLQYAMARQGIDLQKQQERSETENAILEQESTLANDLTNLEKEKNAAIANATSQAEKDYINYNYQQKQLAMDNYWKGLDYELNQDKMKQDLFSTLSNYDLSNRQLLQDDKQFNKQLTQNQSQFETTNKFDYAKLKQENNQFNKSLKLDYVKLNQDKEQFNKNFDQNVKQFTQQLGYDYLKLSNEDKQYYAKLTQDANMFSIEMEKEANKFAEQMQLDKDKLAESKRQFDAQLGFQQDELKENMRMEDKKLSDNLQIAKWDREVALKRVRIEAKQYDEDLQKTLQGNKDREFYAEENNRVDEAVYQLLEKRFNKEITNEEFHAFAKGIIDSSNLTDAMQVQKMSMLNNILNPDNLYPEIGDNFDALDYVPYDLDSLNKLNYKYPENYSGSPAIPVAIPPKPTSTPLVVPTPTPTPTPVPDYFQRNGVMSTEVTNPLVRAIKNRIYSK